MCQNRLSVRATAFICACWLMGSGLAIGQPSPDSSGAAPRSPATPVPADSPASNETADEETASDQAAEEGPPASGAVDKGSGVEVSNYDTVTLNVQNTDLSRVLQLLSMQSKRNIVPSPKVAGTVTANLYDVTFHEALDAVLQQNGAGYLEKGEFIFVYTMDELQKIKENQRELDQRVFRLDYITAQDASEFIKPLMSKSPDATIAMSGEVASGFQPDTSDGGANSYANAELLVVHDYATNLDEIEKIIDQIDTRPEQVLIEATILRAELTDDLAFGVNLSVLGDFGMDELTSGPLGAVDDIMSGDVPGTIPSTPAGGATSNMTNVIEESNVKVGVLTHNVAAFVEALDSITDTTVMANPKVMTLNRQRAEVLVGEKVAYLSTTATSTSTTQTVEFLDTGTQLTVRPFVSDEQKIRMELHPEISTATRQQVSTGEGQAVTLPDEQTQELTTNVMVNDGQTVVLGGLFKEQTEIKRDQVPGLGDIPIVGNAFKGRDDSSVREEVIFLITPHVVKDRSLAKAGDAAKEAIKHRVLGAREGLLPWSRSKLSASHMREALDHLETGKLQKALWEVDLALGLDPTMVEARRLKEKLTGKRVYWPKRSLLNETVNLMIEQKTGERPEPRYPINPDPGPSQMRPFDDNGDSSSMDQQAPRNDGAPQTDAESSSDDEAPDEQQSADDASQQEESAGSDDASDDESSGESAESGSDEPSGQASMDGADGDAQDGSSSEPTVSEIRRAMDRSSQPGAGNDEPESSDADSDAPEQQAEESSDDADASESSADQAGDDAAAEESARENDSASVGSASAVGSDGRFNSAVDEYMDRVNSDDSDASGEEQDQSEASTSDQADRADDN